MEFVKYQGTGNDFILIDNRSYDFPVSQAFIAQLCDRRFGIGADGLILLSIHREGDFRMTYFNADGNESSMCGNGGRCIVKFAHRLGLISDETIFEAADGPHKAFLQNNLVHLQMQEVEKIEKHPGFYFLNTGSPHYVEFVGNLKQEPVFERGRTIRYNDAFASQGGTNVNFVEMLDNQMLFVRTYERGVEDETYSCGTGVVASALAAALQGWKSPIQIRTLGGELEVSFEKKGETFTGIFLVGPAEEVFSGKIA
jgi:diaminopimelate epimerase